MKCVIPCAGKGSRLGLSIPKPLVQVGNKSILEHIVAAWQGCVDDILVIVPPDTQHLFPKALPVRYVTQEKPIGLTDAILQAKPYIKPQESFVVSLGDCLFRGVFHPCDFYQGFGVVKTRSADELNKNYLYTPGRNTSRPKLTEKPYLATVTVAFTNKPMWCGMGVYFLRHKAFEYIEENIDMSFTDILQAMIDNDEQVTPVVFRGSYVNINYPSDIATAERLLAG